MAPKKIQVFAVLLSAAVLLSFLPSCSCGSGNSGGNGNAVSGVNGGNGSNGGCIGSGKDGITEAVSPAVADQPVAFPFPEAPLLVRNQGTVAMAGYLCEHFWNGFLDTSRVFPLSDTLLLGVTEGDFKKAVENYAYLADVLSSDPEAFILQSGGLLSGLDRLLERASALRAADSSSVMLDRLAEYMSLYFYDPNSPFRNENIYGHLASALASSPFVDEVIRGRYRFEAGLCALNPVGSTASDFAFSDSDGRVSNLHGIDADYVIMFFSNPGCEACRQIIGQLVSSPMDASGHSLTELIAAGRMAVLNIYIDSDIEAWKDYSSSYPSDWHNGYDPYGILRDNSLYAVRAIPSLYLLDSEKRVLFKDAVPEKVIAYLQGVL